MSSTVFHGGGVAEAAAQYGRPTSQWLDLSTGINPVPVAIPDFDPAVWHRLPDRDLMHSAMQAAAHFYGSGNVLPVAAAGTQPLIRLAATFVDRDRPVAILSPTYGEYRAVFSAAGLAVDEIANFSDVSKQHGAVVVVNPNNPTGRLYSRADLLALALELAGRNAMLIVDEAFCDLYPGHSLSADVAHYPHMIVLKSIGKLFGLAGLRLSFAISGGDYRARLEEGLGPWPVSGPALEIGRHLLRGGTSEIAAGIRQAHDALMAVLAEAGLPVVGGTGLFALVRVEKASALHHHLCQAGILTRKFSYRTDWLRIGLCANDDELERFRAALLSWRG